MIRGDRIPVGVVVLCTVTIAFVLLLGCIQVPASSPRDSVAMNEWNHICDGAEVLVSLATNATWVTNCRQKLTFGFSVKNVGGLNIVLSNVRLDPAYINITESPSQNLSNGETWSAEWHFTPKAGDEALAHLGIRRGKRVYYSIPLEVNYTIIGSEGIEHPCVLQISPPKPCLTVTILGGDDFVD